MPDQPLHPLTTKEIKTFQDSIFYEILYTFGLPHNLDPTDYFQVEVSNFSRAAHARLLHLLFEGNLGKRRRPDDLVVATFGFVPRITLVGDDLIRINKHLLHLSTSRGKLPAEDKPWPDTILSSLLAPTREFMVLVSVR